MIGHSSREWQESARVIPETNLPLTSGTIKEWSKFLDGLD